jgi:hypothetical protein
LTINSLETTCTRWKLATFSILLVFAVTMAACVPAVYRNGPYTEHFLLNFTIESNPMGANVLMNGQSMGQTPKTITLDLNDYVPKGFGGTGGKDASFVLSRNPLTRTIRLEKEGYNPREINFAGNVIEVRGMKNVQNSESTIPAIGKWPYIACYAPIDSPERPELWLPTLEYDLQTLAPIPKQALWRANLHKLVPETTIQKERLDRHAETASIKSEQINVLTTNISNPASIAILIGNKDYVKKEVPSVDYALNDIEAMKKYLINVFGYREGNIIYETNATKATFEAIFGTKENHMGKLYNYVKKGKSDIFIYYSGHGAPDATSRQGYFVPVDADPQVINLTGYPLKQLYDNIAKIADEKKSPNIFIVIDSCFSGATEKGLLVKNVSPISIEVQNPLMTMPNAVVMTSASGSEWSSWYPEKGHSMFTWFFLKALKEEAEKLNRGEFTAKELFTLINDENEGLTYYVRRLYGRTQTPQLMGDGSRVILKR